MKKMLIAIDGSKGALRGVEYVGEQFGGMGDLRITLYQVSQGVPPKWWDDGHILNEREREARKAVIDKWLDNQKIMIEATFQEAIKPLVKRA